MPENERTAVVRRYTLALDTLAPLVETELPAGDVSAAALAAVIARLAPTVDQVAGYMEGDADELPSALPEDVRGRIEVLSTHRRRRRQLLAQPPNPAPDRGPGRGRPQR
jgi:hypothetical protein